MSFILEALKKSDKKYQEGKVPELGTLHQMDPPVRQKRLWWIWLVVLVLILNASVFLWLFSPLPNRGLLAPKNADQPIAAETNLPVTSVSILPKGDAVALPISKDALPLENRSLPPVAEISDPQSHRESVSEVVPADNSALPPLQKSQAITKISSEPPSPVVGSEPRVYDLSSLPPAVRRDLPEMHISFHAYNQDNAPARLVSINNHLLREGGMLSGKYLLEEITPDGVVFNYGGYRFLLQRKGAQR